MDHRRDHATTFFDKLSNAETQYEACAEKDKKRIDINLEIFGLYLDNMTLYGGFRWVSRVIQYRSVERCPKLLQNPLFLCQPLYEIMKHGPERKPIICLHACTQGNILIHHNTVFCRVDEVLGQCTGAWVDS